jgi:hypothetical protein
MFKRSSRTGNEPNTMAEVQNVRTGADESAPRLSGNLFLLPGVLILKE